MLKRKTNYFSTLNENYSSSCTADGHCVNSATPLIRPDLYGPLESALTALHCIRLTLLILIFRLGDDDYAGIHVQCTENYMQLTLERKHYGKVDPASLHLTDPSCGPTFYNDSIMVIQAPLSSCGTVAGRRGSLLAFRNEVYGDLIGRGAISRAPAYQFRLHCLYYTTAKIMLHSFKPEKKIIVNPPPGISR